MALDCRLSFPVTELPRFLPASPFLFLFAPHYHPALAHIAPIRRSLGFRTIFNTLGPLIHPARPDRMLLGVANEKLGDTYAEVLRLLRVERALVVCGKEGLDEISIAGETTVGQTQSYMKRSAKSGCRHGGSRTVKLPEARSTPPETSVFPHIHSLPSEAQHRNSMR